MDKRRRSQKTETRPCGVCDKPVTRYPSGFKPSGLVGCGLGHAAILRNRARLRRSGRRERIFDFIIAYKAENDGLSPTIRMIGAECEISSTSVVRHHLKMLERAGRIMMMGGGRGGIMVTGGTWSMQAEAVGDG